MKSNVNLQKLIDGVEVVNTDGISRRAALKGMAAFATSSVLIDPSAIGISGALAQGTDSTPIALGQRVQTFDSGWRFSLGDISGAGMIGYDDSSWRRLDLPHDWSIEDLPSPGVGPFNPAQSAGQSRTGYTVGGTAWYRKNFSANGLDPKSRVEIVFDGVYMNWDFWINGQFLGNHPYGYTAFSYDLTPYINFCGNNVIAVRVQNSGNNSRWYSGSGIYRSVVLTVKQPINVPLWGVVVTTPTVSVQSASIQVATVIRNDTTTTQSVVAHVLLTDPNGFQVGIAQQAQNCPPSSSSQVVQSIAISSPTLWSPNSPALYTAQVQLQVAGTAVDTETVIFGIREIKIDALNGFTINGTPMKLMGACMHHDNGVIGSAAIQRAEERRVQLMLGEGFNAIRTSHNPPSSHFLDACDRFGMLVLVEAFDQWEVAKNPDDYHLYFDAWWSRDIASMVSRDRNHPSVIMWSIGNEISEKDTPQGVAISKQLKDQILIYDSTRLITEAVNEAGGAAAFTYLDVCGYNYKFQNYVSDHLSFPNRIIVGTESFPQQVFDNWDTIANLPYAIGDFVWTGMDYIGEAGIGHTVTSGNPQNPLYLAYPWFDANCGDIDLIGNKKPQSYYRDVVWGRSQLEMAVQRPPVPAGSVELLSYWGWSDELRSWTWPGSEGMPLKVRVYSNGDQVQLLLNNVVVGTQSISRSSKLKVEFAVIYASGELRAVALRNGIEIASLAFTTAGAPALLRLTADRPRIAANRNDLSYVKVEVLDAAGNLAPDATVSVAFSLAGPGELAGIGNGKPNEAASFKQPQRNTFKGVCLAVLRPIGSPGVITLTAKATGLQSASVNVQTM